MKLLVTGATGFIGQAFIKSLGHNDHAVVLTRSIDKAVSVFQHTACNTHFIDEIDSFTHLNDFDCVVNLAGEPIADKRWTSEQKHLIQHSRWNITTKLVSLINASDSPPSLLISGSAIGYYGRQDGDPVTETTHQIYEEFTHSLCQTWESIALGARSEKTRVCLLRTGIVLGLQNGRPAGALGKMTLPFKLGLGGRIGDGEQGMSWIHIDDMVKAIHHLIKRKDLDGAFNLTAPKPVSNKVFVSTLARVLNRPAILPTPPFALKLMLGEGADLLLTGQFVLPEALLNSGYQFSYSTLESALRDIYS